jgi:hypothetical protein
MAEELNPLSDAAMNIDPIHHVVHTATGRPCRWWSSSPEKDLSSGKSRTDKDLAFHCCFLLIMVPFHPDSMDYIASAHLLSTNNISVEKKLSLKC